MSTVHCPNDEILKIQFINWQIVNKEDLFGKFSLVLTLK